MVEQEGAAAGAAESKRNGVAEPKAIAVERVEDEASATGGGVDGPDQGRRTTIFGVLAIGIGVVLLAFGVAVYGFKVHIDLAIVAIGGIAGFAIIDLYLRPRRDQRAMRRLRPYMPLWALVPFVLALMTSGWVHYRQWQRGLRDIHELAEELYEDPALKVGHITSTTVENAVHDVIIRHFPAWSEVGAKPPSPDRPAATYQPARMASSPSTSEATPAGSPATTEPPTEAASPGPTEPSITASSARVESAEPGASRGSTEQPPADERSTATAQSETDPVNPDSAAGADEEARTEKRRFIELAHVIGYDLARLEHQDRRTANAGQANDSERRDNQRQASQLQQSQAQSQTSQDQAPQDECEKGSLPRRLTCTARLDTRFHAFLVFFIQALFVLWIPFLLVVSIARASARLPAHDTQDTPGSASAEPSPAQAQSTDSGLRCKLDDVRDLRILAESYSHFMPRLCFAALLLLGTTYVFAPFGLKTSYMMSLVEAHALPGRTSFVLWCNHFAAAPVITVGFVGFLIYALITATQRFMQDDFDDIAMFSLLIRGMVVILLSLALSAAPVGAVSARLFVFVAGIFPMRALAALAKRANITLDPELTVDESRSFAGIPNLDPTKVFVLHAAGVQSTYDLASMPIEEIVGRVRIDPRLLGRAVDHAILIDAVGPEIAGQLAPLAITSATELIEAARTAPPDALSDAARRAADRLARDPRIAELQKWLGYTPSQPAAERSRPAAVAADPVAVAARGVVRSVAHEDPGDGRKANGRGADHVSPPPPIIWP